MWGKVVCDMACGGKWRKEHTWRMLWGKVVEPLWGGICPTWGTVTVVGPKMTDFGLIVQNSLYKSDTIRFYDSNTMNKE